MPVCSDSLLWPTMTSSPWGYERPDCIGNHALALFIDDIQRVLDAYADTQGSTDARLFQVQASQLAVRMLRHQRTVRQRREAELPPIRRLVVVRPKQSPCRKQPSRKSQYHPQPYSQACRARTLVNRMPLRLPFRTLLPNQPFQSP